MSFREYLKLVSLLLVGLTVLLGLLLKVVISGQVETGDAVLIFLGVCFGVGVIAYTRYELS